MRKFAFALSLCASFMLALMACSTGSQTAHRCDATSLEQVVANPLGYADRTFCGRAFAVRQENALVTRLVATPDSPIDNNQTVIIVATDGVRRLAGVTTNPAAYYVEARIDPVRRCWDTPANANGETCVPFVKPVIFHVTDAKRLP